MAETKGIEFETFKKFTADVAAGKEPVIVSPQYVVISTPVFERMLRLVPAWAQPHPNRDAEASKRVTRVAEISESIKARFGPKEER